MARKLSDFRELGAYKKQLAEAGPVQKKKTAMPMRHDTSIKPAVATAPKQHPEIVVGIRVRMMDTCDNGTVVGIGDGWFEIESDGLVFRAQRCEFAVTDANEEKLLRKSAGGTGKSCEKKRSPSAPQTELTMDLHFEKIPGSKSIPQSDALDFQMNYFRHTIRQNLKYKGRRILFIHGVGEGILASSLRGELDTIFAISCTYTYCQPGVTAVTIK